jgi:hypothetical protein
VRHWATSIKHRVGHRGAVLLGLGVFDLLYGYTKMINPDEVSRNSQQLRLLAEVFPLGSDRAAIVTWGLLWWLAGAFCLVNAFRHEDRWGYGAAIGIKISWLLGNAYAWSQGLIGGGSTLATWSLVLYFAVVSALRAEPTPELDDLIHELESHTGEVPRVRDDGEDD